MHPVEHGLVEVVVVVALVEVAALLAAAWLFSSATLPACLPALGFPMSRQVFTLLTPPAQAFRAKDLRGFSVTPTIAISETTRKPIEARLTILIFPRFKTPSMAGRSQFNELV